VTFVVRIAIRLRLGRFESFVTFVVKFVDTLVITTKTTKAAKRNGSAPYALNT
jgi:hypothetical protein